MKTIGNVLWVVLCGAVTALGWLIIAGLLAVTVVGLPFARQCLKLARLTLWPFGRTVVKSPTASTLGPVGAVLWFIPGACMAIAYGIAGALLCVTVIGLPFGLQAFKFAGLALAPFGKAVVKTSDVTAGLEAAMTIEAA